MVGGRPDERHGAPPTITTFTAPRQHHRIAAADAVIADGAKVLREPIDDSQCPASTKDAIDQLEAASADARQLARDPFAAQTNYLQPVSWVGLEDVELPHPNQPTHVDNVPYFAPGLYSYFGLLKYSRFIATISREACTVNMCG